MNLLKQQLDCRKLLSTVSVLLFLVTSLSFSVVTLHAEEAQLVLKNGQKSRGTLVKQDDKFVTLKMFVGVYLEKKFAIADIESITIKGKRYDLVNTSDGKSTLPELTKEVASAPKAVISALGYVGFRNDHTGIFPNADPPIKWTAGENLWHVPLEGKSNASPVFTADKVICCEEPNFLVCVDKVKGTVLWKKSNSLADAGEDGTPHSPNWIGTYGWTCPTPITDGQAIWASFGNGVVSCYGVDGERKWIKKVQPSGRYHGTSGSGCMIDDTFVVYMAGGGGGKYVGFDKNTGSIRYEFNNKISQGGLFPIRMAEKNYVVSSGGFMFEARSGTIVMPEMLGDGKNWGPTVVIDPVNLIAFFHVEFSQGLPIRAVKLTPNVPREQLWEYISNPTGELRNRMGSSPLFYQGIFYAVRDDGLLYALDASDGKEIYTEKLPRHSYSSLVIAGPYIYAFGGSMVTIFKPGRKYEQVAQFNHGFKSFIGSAVFDGKVMYFRDGTGLHCIAKK